MKTVHYLGIGIVIIGNAYQVGGETYPTIAAAKVAALRIKKQQTNKTTRQ